MVTARLEVLADGQHLATVAPQVAHHFDDLLVCFTEPHHQPRLGGHLGMPGLEPLQEVERPLVVGAGTRLAVQPRHRLQVVVEHVGRRPGQPLQRHVHPPAEVGDEDLDPGGGTRLAHRTHAGREMARAAVAEIVAIDRGDHHVAQPQHPDRLRETRRLVRVEGVRPAVGDVAERAPAGAEVAHDHERGGAVREALRRFGQDASSHTLCSPCARSSRFTRATAGPTGARTRIHGGFLGRGPSDGITFTGIREVLSRPRISRVGRLRVMVVSVIGEV